MVRIALAQLNPHVGDVEGNAQEVHAAWQRAAEAGADLVVFPELVLTGYPPEDLLVKPEFVRANLEALERLAEQMGEGPAALIGFVDRADDGPTRDGEEAGERLLRNAAAFVTGGRVAARYHQRRVPTYGVFDEARWFAAGRDHLVVNVGETPVGVTICEDLRGEAEPVLDAVHAGARLVVNLDASAYHRGAGGEREQRVRALAAEHRVPIAHVNAVGGQDGIVFDGDSMVTERDGEIVARGTQFEEDLVLVELDLPGEPIDGAPTHPTTDGERPPIDRQDDPRLDEVAEVWEAVVLGLRDYCRKNGFERVALGLSGGIDSTLTAAVAADAVGPQNVLGVSMPSRFTSDRSHEDIDATVEGLGIELATISIDPLMDGFDEALSDIFGDRDRDETEENIQARIRGVLLMAISNKLGHLVLATGNKSEAAVGYATLYGDTVGGFAPLIDCTKQLVYALAEHRNERGTAIPESVISKAPSAELAPGQIDEDSLPPYEVLDAILELYLEQDHGVEAIVAQGYDEGTVREVIRLIDNAEFKRQQAPPGTKVTERSFNHDRHVPITNGWRP